MNIGEWAIWRVMYIKIGRYSESFSIDACTYVLPDCNLGIIRYK